MIPESLPATLPKLLAALLDRLDRQSAHGPLICIALSALVSARYGLSEGELLEVLFQDHEYSNILAQSNEQYGHELPPKATRIPIALWTRLRSDLAPYLAERSAPGTAVVHFYHRQVEQAVRVRYLKSAELQARRWADLARYFSGRWNLPETHNLPDAHALMELPHLLLLCEDHLSLLKLLTDLQFPKRKTHAGYVSDLVKDYNDLRTKATEEANDSLAPWYYSVRGNASFLSEHPTSFFQQAYNEPVQSPVSQAAQLLWTQTSETHFTSAPTSPVLTPTAFLEWLNRPSEWHPPACLMTLYGHSRISTVAISSDGLTIVSGATWSESVKV